MNKRHFVTGILIGTFALAPAQGQACGESLMRLGQGLRYQVYQAKLPANVLVFRGPSMPAVRPEAGQAFVDGLRKAGHRVTVVDATENLGEALQAQRFDVVIAGAGDADVVAAEVGSVPRAPVVVPVLSRGATNASAVRANYPHVLNIEASFGQCLRLLNQVMAARA